MKHFTGVLAYDDPVSLKRFSPVGIALLAVWLIFGSIPVAARGSAAPSTLQIFVQPSSQSGPVLSLIASARHSIRLEVYLLTERPIVDALASAKGRGVSVRVLLEERPYGADRSAQEGYSLLQAKGIAVRWANEAAFTYTHEKAMVIDGQVAGIFTFNLTAAGIFENREFGVINRNRNDATTLAAVFDADWKRQAPHISYGDLVISPYNSRADLDTLIDSARHTLDLYEEEIDDPGIENHIEHAVQHHVRVRLIISQSSAGVDALRSAGVAVKIMPHPYVHAKAIVADGARFFVGSENVSNTSLDHNREVGILTTNQQLASRIEATFNADWSGGGSPPPPPSSKPIRGPFSVHVTVSPSTVRRGQLLDISAATKPGASCSVRVTYPDRYVSRASALARTEVAGSDGVASWSWHEGSTVTGTGQVSVTCCSAAKPAAEAQPSQ